MNRPLTKASYALQDLMHGSWAPGFHGANVVLHLIAALLAYFLLRRAFAFTGERPLQASLAAFAVAAIWAVHPALTETVSYVSGRSMGLSACLMLAALLAASGRQTKGAGVAAFLLALLAPLARETALVLPAILMWWQLTVQKRESRAAAVARFLPVLGGTLIGAAVIFSMPRHQELIGESLRARPPLEALLGNVHAASDILFYWIAPWRVTIDPAPPLAWPWDDAGTLARLGLFAAMALAALALRRRAPVTALGIGLALLALAPSNSILWRADPVALKPLYLGGLGLTLAVAALLVALAGRSRAAQSFLLTLALAAVLVFGAQTAARNALFADEIALWRDATEKTPGYGRPWIMLGYALFNEGRYGEAAAALRYGTNLAPWDDKAAAALALVEAILARGAS